MKARTKTAADEHNNANSSSRNSKKNLMVGLCGVCVCVGGVGSARIFYLRVPMQTIAKSPNTIASAKQNLTPPLFTMKIAALLVLFVTHLTVVTSFAPVPLPLAVARSNSATHLMMAGFGGGGGGKKEKNKKLPKLKAKAQWDRYADLKQCSKVVVGVKLSGDGEGDWLEVGKVRSQNDEHTLIAIARQRALIAGKLNKMGVLLFFFYKSRASNSCNFQIMPSVCIQLKSLQILS